MKEVTVQELKEMMDKKEDFQLIDVREEYETEICSIGGELMPMQTIPTSIDKISKDKKVIIYCRSGNRSGNVVHYLESQTGLTNLYNLHGGILAWAGEIDKNMASY